MLVHPHRSHILSLTCLYNRKVWRYLGHQFTEANVHGGESSGNNSDNSLQSFVSPYMGVLSMSGPDWESQRRNSSGLPMKQVLHVDEISPAGIEAAESRDGVKSNSLSGFRHYPTTAPGHGRQGETRWSRMREKGGLLWAPLGLLIATFLFLILYSLYVYDILIIAEPHLGSLLMSASDTNLAVSILSQIFAQLVGLLIGVVLDTLRWQLASRADGVSFSTFFQLGGATTWISVLTFTLASGLRNLSGVFR